MPFRDAACFEDLRCVGFGFEGKKEAIMKRKCGNCAFWTSFSDSDDSNKPGQCDMVCEHESRVHGVFLVRKKGSFAFEGISPDDPVFQNYDLKVNLITPADHCCDAFQKVIIT